MVDGTPFGRYRLIELLGRGGMGEVWHAHDTEIDRPVAIKMLLPHFAKDSTFERRFRREARAAARLEDPHVVPIYDVGEIDGRLYVTMRLIRGDDLQTLIGRGPLNPDRSVRIIEQVAAALQAAHNAGLVHRDVKPSNILVAEDDFAYLIDFGIAHVAGESGLTTAGATIGTWAYMAPERFQTGEVAPSCDTYALACVLYQALTGKLPFPGSTLDQIVVAHLTIPPPKPSTRHRNIPAQMDAVIAAGLAKNPDERTQSVKELALAARAALVAPKPPAAAEVSSNAKGAPIAPPVRTASAKPSSAYAQPFAPIPGSWAKVMKAGHDHHGQVGRVIEISDGAEGDVIVTFPGEPRRYAFRRDELIPAPRPSPRPADLRDFWARVGIDPIRIVTSTCDLRTLRCYLGNDPIFLGSSGMVDVFQSQQALRRYLAGKPSNDMSSLITYRDVTRAAADGSLPLDDVAEDNVYVLKGLPEAIGDGRVDREQLELAVELLSDVGGYAKLPVVDNLLRPGQPLGDLVKRVRDHVIVPSPGRIAGGQALAQWTRLEDFLESRLRVNE